MGKVEDLDVFKLSHSLALKIFELTKTFPEGEKFGLVSQMGRGAYSIPMSLTEGAHRLSFKEYRQFVGIAKGSAAEIKYQLLPVEDLKYIPDIFLKVSILFSHPNASVLVRCCSSCQNLWN